LATGARVTTQQEIGSDVYSLDAELERLLKVGYPYPN